MGSYLIGYLQKLYPTGLAIAVYPTGYIPHYHRWESGVAPVPAAKLKKLAKVLEATVDEILGKRAPFDLLGINEKIGDARKYFGEVAIHFGPTRPLLLPISEETRSEIYSQLQGGRTFILIQSLDNRTVYIRRTAIKDLHLSSEAYDTFGPEKYEDNMGVFPDDDFWYIVENMESLDDLDEPLDEKRIEEVLKQVRLTDDQLDELVSSGKVHRKTRTG
jgi:transcriptional regulator with XRE-family HTH domain